MGRPAGAGSLTGSVRIVSDFAPVLLSTLIPLLILAAGASLVGGAAFGKFKTLGWRVAMFTWGITFTFIGGVAYVGYIFSLWEV